MDILKILKESQNEILKEDLDFFVTELDTGNYEEKYILECREEIEKLRNWLLGNNKDNKENTKEKVLSGLKSINEIAPKEVNPFSKDQKSDEIILDKIKTIRERGSYKSEFKAYIEDNKDFTITFIEKNLSFFEPVELALIISIIDFDETFLEKYFSILDHEKIARYQKFSENFFMKHFNELDYNVVLVQGKNDWKRKENRSKQLDVFLRLKGVKI